MEFASGKILDVNICIPVVYRRPTIRSAYGVLFLWYNRAVCPVECTGYDASETICDEVSRGDKSPRVFHDDFLRFFRSPSKIISFLRFLASRQVNVQILDWYSPSLGVTIVGALMVVFIFGWSFCIGPSSTLSTISILALLFSNHKFYWENFNMGHSPPLGTRGGWVSLAIMPFMLYVNVTCTLV